MSDYFAAKIQIGGHLSPTLRRQLIQVAAEQGVQAEDYGGDSAAEAVERTVDAAIASRQPVTFHDEQACYGCFDELEQFCREHNLPYRRHNESRYEVDAAWLWWRSGWKEVRRCPADNRGAVLVDAAAMRKMFVAGGSVATLQEYLDEHTPGEVPPLVVEGWSLSLVPD